MDDPSRLVQPHVLPHVHLVVQHRLPIAQSFSPEQALDFLKNAPGLVRREAAVAWKYFQTPPQDGQLLLIWRSQARQGPWSSDGYVWADPEQSYSFQNVRGYSLEVWIHQTGLRLGAESVASHKRTRYRITHKEPGVDPNLPPPDPSLWLVHYSQSDQRIPAERMPVNMEIQGMLQQRQALERAGQLQEKQFMLHDVSNHPRVEPVQAMGGMHRLGPGQQPVRDPRFHNQHQGAVGPPPPKRQRGPPTIPVARQPVAIPVDELEEENTTFGDLLDHLTPSEISKMRYTQHHEWMEEIFSSPYAAGQIAPIDMGFGLTGQLGTLTNGILNVSKPIAQNGAPQPEPPAVYKKLEPGQFDEFKSRVEEYEREVTSELEKLKADHAKKLADLKRTKTYVVAERRLKEAGLALPDPSDDTVGTDEKVANIVHELETSAKVSVAPRKGVTTVDKGGLVEETMHSHAQHSQSANTFQENGGLPGLETDNTAASLLDEFTQNSGANTPAATGSLTAISQPISASQSQAATPNAPSVPQDGTQADLPAALVNSSDLPVADDMDIDAEMPVPSADSEWVMVDGVQNPDSTAAPPDGTDQITSAPANQDSGVLTKADAVPESAGDAGAVSPGMFDTEDFGTFDGLDTAGDALADYTNDGDLDLNLDDSAFDGFQNTETAGNDNP